MNNKSLLRQSLMARENQNDQDQSNKSLLRRSLEKQAGVAPGSFAPTNTVVPTTPQRIYKPGAKAYAPINLRSLAESTIAPASSQEQTAPKYVSPFAKNEDYKELSQYKSTKKEKGNNAPLAFLLPGLSKSSEYEDKWYEYVNRNPDVVDLTDADLAKMGASFSAANRSYLKQMTDEQIADYNYVYATKGKDEAEKFLDSLQKDLTAKQNEKFVERTQEYAREHPVSASVASVIAGPAKGLSLIGQLAEYADTGDIDPNSLSNRFVKQNQTIRQTVPENWSKVGQFLYGTGMSIADNLYNMALTGAFGNIGGLGEGAQSLILGIMGSSAAADSTLTALENGYSADRAMLQGAIAGGIEVLTEKISLETLLSPNAFKDGTIKYLLKNAAAEGSEEGASTVANWVVDWIGDLITDENRSDFRQVFTAFQRGDSKEGWRKIGEMGLDLAQDVAGGMLSGGVLAGGGSVANTIGNINLGSALNQTSALSDTSEFVNDSYADSLKNPDATRYQKQLSQRALEQFYNDGKVSNRTLGELAQNNMYMAEEQANTVNLLNEASQRINQGKQITSSQMREILDNKQAVRTLRDNYGLRLNDNMSYSDRFSAVQDALTNRLNSNDAQVKLGFRADMVAKFAKTLGSQGERTLNAMARANGYEDVEAFSKGYTQIYNAVKADPEVKLNDLSVKADYSFTPQQLNTIYKSAVKDYEADLKKTGLSYEGETNAEETATGSQDSGTDGVGTVSLDTEVSTGSVAGRAAEVESRRKAADVRIESIRNNAALNSIAEVTSAEAGIPGGVNTDQAKTVRVLSESQWSALDTDTYNFLHELKDMGYEVKAWTGTALAYDEMSGKNAAVRGFIQGNTIGVRVDANLSARKIAYHEMFHDMVKTDSSLQADMVKKINEHYGEGKLETIVRDYVSQYGWTQASDEEILNEILADAYAGIDIYEDLEMNYEGATQVSADVRGFLSENGVKTRNGNNAGQFSRDSEGNDISPGQAEYFKDSKIRDEDGNLQIVYHGTDADFTVFDRTKGRSNMDIQGSFFSPWELDAAGYGGNVKAYYLNIKNPAPESVAYRALNRFKGQNNVGVKAREYLERLGYDGVNNGNEEYIAFHSEQIKEVENVNPTSNPDVRYSTEAALEQHGIELVDGTATKYSLDTWNETDKDRVLDALVKAGFSRSEASKWIDDVNSIAAIILGDRYRLDYDAADNQVMLKNNEEYVKTLDSSTLCAKRLLYQGTFNRITELLPDSILTPDDLIHIRKVMAEMGDTVPCGICYVESRRKTLSTFAGRWLNEVYKGETKVTMNDLTSTVGLEKLRSEHPDIYNDYTSWMRKRGTANPKIVELRTSYRNDISKLTKGQIAKIIRIGGLRVQSFSDFETVHLIDMMQAILDMSAKGLTSQAYTKVPNFAWAFGDTGIKINLSLIGKAQNGKLVFDSKEGMDINDAMKLRERYSDNVGTILVGANDESILLAMADDRIDFIIPFHRSGWSQSQFEDLGLSGYDDYQAYQNERHLDGSAISEGNLYPIDYWDYSKTGKENAERYLEICKEQGRIPKFERFLVDNGDGSWSLQPDGSTDGYWKMLIDFKMYNNQGIGAPQRAVTPTFNMEECERILNEYDGEGNRSLPVDEEAAQKFVEEYKAQHQGQFSRDTDYMEAVNSGDMDTAQRMVDEAAKEAGYTAKSYHGTLSGGFTVFDRSYAHVGGNSGAGFYTSTTRADAEGNYSDVEGADNYFKARNLAEKIEEAIADGFWEGPELSGEDEILEYAKQQITKKPQTYTLYGNPGKTYVRDYRNSTNIYDDIMDDFDESLVDREDYDSDEDYEDDLFNYQSEHLYESIENAVYEAMDSMEEQYEYVDFTFTVADLTQKIANEAVDYQSLTWKDISDAIMDIGEVSVAFGDENEPAFGEPELTRAIIEAFGYDSITDREVSKKFNQIQRMGDLGADTEHVIYFRPEQMKLADTVTRDDQGNVIPLSQRFNSQNNDIRYSRDSDQDNRVKANFGTMFSGTGTVDFALRNVINHSFAVEYDNNISAVYRMNNGDEIYEGDVRDAVKQGYIDDKEVDFLHASPVCKDYSAQKQDATETPLDISTAKAVADVIDSKKPKLVTIENVRGYKNSQAVKLIQGALDRNGYVWDEGTYKASDFGGATIRERYFIRAARDVDELPAIPERKPAKSWYEATKDLIPDLKEMPLKEDGYMASRWNELKDSIDRTHPVLLLRGTKGGKLVYAEYDKPSPTIIASETEARIVMPDGRFLEASPRVLARIQGLPDEFQLPKQKTLANKVVGNGVPVELTQAVLGSLLPVISGENYSDIRFSRDTTGTESELQKQNRELNKELKEVTERYHYFKDQLVLTKVRQATEQSANRVAKQLVKDYSSNVSADEIAKALREASKLVLNVKDDTDIDELQTQLKDALRPYAMQMVTNASELMNAEDVETQKSIRNDLRNGAGIIVTDQMKKDVPDWASFRKAQFGNMKLVSGPKTNIHDVYLELSQKYGESYFPQDVANESDMLQVIADVMADLSAIYDNPYTYGGANIAEAIESCTNDMMMSVVGSLEAEQPTFADKEKAKRDALRKQAIEAKNAALQRVREQRDDALAKQTARYKDRIDSIYRKRKQYEYRGKIRKKSKDLSTLLLRPTDKRHIPYELQGVVLEVLKRIDTSSGFDLDWSDSSSHVPRGMGMMTGKTNAFLNLKQQLSELKNHLVLDPSLFDSEDGGTMGMLSTLSGLESRSIDDMNLEQLDAVYTVLRNVENLVRKYNKALKLERFETISEAATAIFDENGNKTSRDEYVKGIEDTINLLAVDSLTPQAYFHRLGKSGDALFKMLRAAQDDNIRILREAQKFSEDHGLYKLKLKKYERELVTVRFGNRDVEMSKAQLMELYVLNKRDASRMHLEVGGILPEPVQRKRSIKKVTYSEAIHNITQEDIAKAMTQLSAEDIALADAMQEFLSKTISKHGNDASMRVYGYKKFGEENYWPIRVNDQDLKTELGKAVKQRRRTVSQMGFTIAIKPNAKQSVFIGSIFDTFSEHVAEMATYSSYLDVTEDLNRIYNFNEKDESGAIEMSTKLVLRKVLGPKGEDYFTKLAEDIANPVPATPTFLSGLIGKFKAAAVGSNLRVIIQQPTAIFRAMSMIDPKYLAIGIAKFRKGASKAVEKAPIAQWKEWGYFDISTGRSVKNILFENSSTLDRAQNVLMAGAGKADSVAWGALYSAVEAETKDLRPDLDPRSKEFDDVVVARFSDIIDQTQVVDGVLQRSHLMRSENWLDKTATSFMAEPTKQLNMMMTAVYDLVHGENKGEATRTLARTTGALLFAGVLNAAVQSIVDAIRNDDPEKDYWEKFLAKFTGDEATFACFLDSNLGDFLNPMQYVTYAKDIYSLFQGFEVERMDTSLLKSAINDGKSLVNAFNGKGKYSLTNNLINFMNTMSKFLGLSVSNVKRDVAGIANTIAQETGSYVFEYRMAKFTYNLNQATNKGRFVEVLAKAYEAGDQEAFDIIMNDLIKEDKFATTTMTTEEWIKKRLKDKHQIILK